MKWLKFNSFSACVFDIQSLAIIAWKFFGWRCVDWLKYSLLGQRLLECQSTAVLIGMAEIGTVCRAKICVNNCNNLVVVSADQFWNGNNTSWTLFLFKRMWTTQVLLLLLLPLLLLLLFGFSLERGVRGGKQKFLFDDNEAFCHGFSSTCVEIYKLCVGKYKLCVEKYKFVINKFWKIKLCIVK